ncbi:hypothetical protein GIB67_020630 [Kingdonia uniflora]|uniref:Uncharacterized protein n=1 Tax=Kingdonia uniflora TaxID=39325 RepID=A0A7J7M950_9MAGN|nr:hypothetical protein GIB67_020630 [Kingdonia uniflora]
MLVPISALLRHQAKASLYSSSRFSTLVPTEVVPRAVKLSWGSDQPGTPARTYEAPTLSSDWSKTHGSNYSEPGTPQLSSPAYANAPSPYVPSTPGIQLITPGSACYLPGTPGVQPMTPGGVMPPVIGTRVVVAPENMSFGAIIRVESEDSSFSMLNFIKFAQLLNFTFTVGSKRLKMKLQKSS